MADKRTYDREQRTDVSSFEPSRTNSIDNLGAFFEVGNFKFLLEEDACLLVGGLELDGVDLSDERVSIYHQPDTAHPCVALSSPRS